MRTWVCYKQDCGHLVLAAANPTPLKWDDGHICVFQEREYDPPVPKEIAFPEVANKEVSDE